MMHKKAQITMETILIYGIIAIVVLTGIGALIYFGVFDLGNYLPDKCSLNTGDLSCDQWVATAGAPIQFGFKNNMNKLVTIYNVNLTQPDGLQVFSGPRTSCLMTCTVGTQANPKSTASCTETGDCIILSTFTGQKVKFNMVVQYQPQGGAIQQKASGEMIVKIQ